MFNVDEFNTVLDSPCTFHEGALTPSVSASSSRGRSARPMTRSNLEAMTIGHLHIATATSAATIDVAAAKMLVVMTGDAITRS
jgi:hypothetical protein